MGGGGVLDDCWVFDTQACNTYIFGVAPISHALLISQSLQT